MAQSSKTASVRGMWDAWNHEGIDAFLAIAPPDVEWRPSVGGGKALWGSRDIRTFFKGMQERGERFPSTDRAARVRAPRRRRRARLRRGDRQRPRRVVEIREAAEDGGGLGLRILDRMTTRWGVYEGSTNVWFELRAD